MTEQIEVEIHILEEILNEMRQEGLDVVSTIDILRKYQGGYLKNSGVSASQSFNAKFGKALKRLEDTLNIQEIESKTPQNDDLGERTTCSIWSL